MSLISILYSGDADVIETAFKYSNESSIPDDEIEMLDFSGGVSRTWFYADDFYTLLGEDGFWKLESGDLLGKKSDECGLFKLPTDVINRIIGLTKNDVEKFMTLKKKSTPDQQERYSIWRNKTYWKFLLGGVIALGLAYVKNTSSITALILLVGWIFGMLFWGIYLGIKNKNEGRRRKKNHTYDSLKRDWREDIAQLRAFAKRAKDYNKSLYYFWSL